MANGVALAGCAFPDDSYRNMPDANDINDSIVIGNHTRYYSLAHEFMHILRQESKHDTRPRNLFVTPTTGIITESDTSIRDTKRLVQAQQNAIQQSPYAH